MTGAEECGTGAGKDLEDEKGDNTTMNNTHNNQTEYGGGKRKTETVAVTLTAMENGGRKRRNA